MLVWFEPHERMDEAIAREKYNNSRVIARNASERRGDPRALLQPYNPELLRRDSPSEDGRLSALWLAMTTAETLQIGLRFALHVPRGLLAPSNRQLD
jgi:hypothetical protein